MDLGVLVEDVCEDVTDAGGAASYLGPRGIEVTCRPSVINRAVANLVDNAVKFTPEGGKVDIELLRGNSETVVRVADTGPGISEQEREAVLRRFYRSDKIRNTPGIGLGLNLVAAIVKLHGFRLAIRSGPGCRMEITCPDPQEA